jgi:hypothetical protein
MERIAEAKRQGVKQAKKDIAHATETEVQQWVENPIRIHIAHSRHQEYYLEVRVKMSSVEAAGKMMEKWHGWKEGTTWVLQARGRIRVFLTKIAANSEIKKSAFFETIRLAFEVLDFLKPRPAKRPLDWKVGMATYCKQFKNMPQWKC